MGQTEAETIVDLRGIVSVLDDGLQIVRFPVLCDLNLGMLADRIVGVSRLGNRTLFRVTSKAWHSALDSEPPILNSTQNCDGLVVAIGLPDACLNLGSMDASKSP